MAWITPTGASGWTDSGEVRDNVLTSEAYTSVAASQWSVYLEVTIGVMSCDKVRFYAYYHADEQSLIDLDVYWSGAWHHIYQGSYTDRAWVEKSLGGIYSVTKARMRFYNAYPATNDLLCYEFDFNSSPPSPPTNVQATDGVHTDKVVITWTKSSGATGYQVYRNGTPLGWLGDVATYNDTGAGAPTITPGSASASDGEFTEHVALSLSGQSANNGTTHTYKVKAKNTAGESGYSGTNTGYRGVGSLTYQWQRSAGDSDADYSNIDGATTASYNDTEAPADGSGRYYRCVINATGAAQQISASDRGYRLVEFEYVGTGSFTYSGSGSYYYEISDWEYVGSGNFVFSSTGIYSLGFAYTGSGELTYSGDAITTIGFAYTGSGELTYSGVAIVTIGFTSVGSGTYNFSGVGLYSLGSFYVGVGEFVYSGSATQVHTYCYLYEGSGAFNYLGEAVCRYRVFWSKVAREMGDWTKVDKEREDWNKVNREKGDWEKIDEL